VDLTTLSVQHLSEVKKQLDEGKFLVKITVEQELEHLSQSFAQLRQAKAKFLDCIKSINDGGKEGYEGQFETLAPQAH
jgi:prefoldin subunit 5